jgi:hypothetical protein
MPGPKNERSLLADFLSFDRVIAGESLKLVYWIGLGLIALIPLGAIGAGVGIAIHDFPVGILAGIAGIVIGFLTGAALLVLWRLFCEFFAAVFRLSEDLRAWREAQDTERDRDIFRR